MVVLVEILVVQAQAVKAMLVVQLQATFLAAAAVAVREPLALVVLDNKLGNCSANATASY